MNVPNGPSTPSGHRHAAAMDRAFAAGILLNAAFLVLEVFYGLRSHALALLADAAHNFGDVLSLALSWLALWFAGRESTLRRTYGFRRAGILAALLNGLLLLLTTGGLLWEALRRFWHPEPTQGMTMAVVGAVGMLVNAGSALLFLRGRHHDLNVRGAFLHLMADAGVALGVVLAGAGILLTGWNWLDPAVSAVVGMVILAGTWPLFRSALDLALDAVPAHVDTKEVEGFLLDHAGTLGCHHLHVWALSTTSTALSVHLVLVQGTDAEGLVHDLARGLHDRFGIDHATIQPEFPGSQDRCLLGQPMPFCAT